MAAVPVAVRVPIPPCAQSFGYAAAMFIFRTLVCPSLEVEGTATIATKPLSQKVVCSIGQPLPGT